MKEIIVSKALSRFKQDVLTVLSDIGLSTLERSDFSEPLFNNGIEYYDNTTVFTHLETAHVLLFLRFRYNSNPALQSAFCELKIIPLTTPLDIHTEMYYTAEDVKQLVEKLNTK